MSGTRAAWLVLTGTLLFLGSGCGAETKAPEPVRSDAPVLKVAVLSDGRMTVDGAPATVESMRESLKSLAARKGVVWYYREAAQGEPAPQAMEVIKAVAENGLPIRLSSRPDYSDSIGPDGLPVPK